MLFPPSHPLFTESGHRLTQTISNAQWAEAIRDGKRLPNDYNKASYRAVGREQGTYVPLCVPAFPARRYFVGAGWREIDLIEPVSAPAVTHKPWEPNRLRDRDERMRRAKRAPSPLAASDAEQQMIEDGFDIDHDVTEQEMVEYFATLSQRQKQPFKYASQEDIDRAKNEAVTMFTQSPRSGDVRFVGKIKEGQDGADVDDQEEEEPQAANGGPSTLLFGEGEGTREEESEEVDRLEDLEQEVELARLVLEQAEDMDDADEIKKASIESATAALEYAQQRLREHAKSERAQAKDDRAAIFKSSRLWRKHILDGFETAHDKWPDGSELNHCCSASSCSARLSSAEKLQRERDGVQRVKNSGRAVSNKRFHMGNDAAALVFGSDAASYDENLTDSLVAVFSSEKPWGYTEGLWKSDGLKKCAAVCRCGEDGTPHPIHEFEWSPSDEPSEKELRNQEADNKRRPNESEQEHARRVTNNLMERQRLAFVNTPLDNVLREDMLGDGEQTEREGDGGDLDSPVSIGCTMDWAYLSSDRTRTNHLERRVETRPRTSKRKRGIPVSDEVSTYDDTIYQGVRVWRDNPELHEENPTAPEDGGMSSLWGDTSRPSADSEWMKSVSIVAELMRRYPSGTDPNKRSEAEWQAFAKEFGSDLKGESFRRSVLKTMMQLFSHPDIRREELPEMATKPNVAKVREWAAAFDGAWSELYAARDWDMEGQYHDENDALGYELEAFDNRAKSSGGGLTGSR